MLLITTNKVPRLWPPGTSASAARNRLSSPAESRRRVRSVARRSRSRRWRCSNIRFATCDVPAFRRSSKRKSTNGPRESAAHDSRTELPVVCGSNAGRRQAHGSRSVVVKVRRRG